MASEEMKPPSERIWLLEQEFATVDGTTRTEIVVRDEELATELAGAWRVTEYELAGPLAAISADAKPQPKTLNDIDPERHVKRLIAGDKP